MADPRFYDNRGPVTLSDLCAKVGISLPQGKDPRDLIYDLAGLEEAGPQNLSFCDGTRAEKQLALTQAGWCFVKSSRQVAPSRQTVFLPCASVAHAFAAAASLFYRPNEYAIQEQNGWIDPSARLGEGVIFAPGAVIGQGVEIGANTRIGANAVIGRGVSIGRNCEIGASAWIGFSSLGDDVVIGPGARIGGPGFGFASGAQGHTKLPQLGRVIVQDRVEIGPNSTVDRGALGDTVIGEGTKIDNLVQIGHNTKIGRHCILVSQVGLSGSIVLGDFVVLGGQVGVADHVVIGDHARVAAASGVTKSLPGARDYGGIPARLIREWHKEVAVVARLAKRREQAK